MEQMKVWQDKKSSVAAETTTLPTDLSPSHTGLSLHRMLLSRACVRFARLRQDNKSSAAVMSPQPFQPQPSGNNFWGTLGYQYKPDAQASDKSDKSDKSEK